MQIRKKWRGLSHAGRAKRQHLKPRDGSGWKGATIRIASTEAQPEWSSPPHAKRRESGSPSPRTATADPSSTPPGETPRLDGQWRTIRKDDKNLGRRTFREAGFWKRTHQSGRDPSTSPDLRQKRGRARAAGSITCRSGKASAAKTEGRDRLEGATIRIASTEAQHGWGGPPYASRRESESPSPRTATADPSSSTMPGDPPRLTAGGAQIEQNPRRERRER